MPVPRYNIRYRQELSMTKSLKIRRIGNSYGLILSKELLDELGVGEGDVLYPVRTTDGVRLTPYDPEFATAMETSRDFVRRYRNAMRELAKR
jgi:putative addiction module antidote